MGEGGEKRFYSKSPSSSQTWLGKGSRQEQWIRWEQKRGGVLGNNKVEEAEGLSRYLPGVKRGISKKPGGEEYIYGKGGALKAA